jgi:CIC family chloride channel protein
LPFRQVLLSSEPSFILLAALVGLAAGTAVVVIHGLAVSIQIYLFGFSPEAKLSPERMVSPWYLLIALPVGGAIIGFTRTIFAKRLKSAVDVMEANALYGGRIPFRDSIVLIFQNIISNGFGASVGLEAAYAQAGGGIASRAGQVLDLKRQNLRTLVGAGAGAAIAAAFGAPLAGAFYAFEIVLGGYTAATLAPVAAACLMGVLAAQTLNFDPFVVASSANH